MMRDDFKKFSESAGQAVDKGSKRGKKGVVYFVTSDKVIQAVMTASAFAVVASTIENVAFLIRALTGFPHQPVILINMILVFWIALWIDNNTDRWRDMVEYATGEEVADD